MIAPLRATQAPPAAALACRVGTTALSWTMRSSESRGLVEDAAGRA